MQNDQNQNNSGPLICVDTRKAFFLIYLAKVAQSLCQNSNYEQGVCRDEQKKVLVVSFTQTVIYKRAMMVETVHTLIAN